ncbi:CRISPR-associated endonuclease Cas2 [Mediterraneibacter faecis]|uniref:CRISPR-associated endonuclease Cas2 n=1 Tax=Mediterraneibacter faecis TaxID=592978 RepID=UPI0022E25701|nr:CRISPR-associated endonuclease Cas2 [Mediterraneibacter faecis]
MFVIVTYDVNAKKNNKVLKICRKYLLHVQKSVFEGMITEAKLKRLKNELAQVIKKDEDSIMIYRFETLKYSSKEVIGVFEKDTNFL